MCACVKGVSCIHSYAIRGEVIIVTLAQSIYILNTLHENFVEDKAF